MKYFIITFLMLSFYFTSTAQTDPEFPQEFIMHIKLHNGMVTNFGGASPDLYTGGVQLIPQYTIIAHLLRVGIVADGFYTSKKLQASAGPTASIKLKTFRVKPFGSAGNLFLNIDHLWGTQQQRLLGGGINADLGNKIVIALSAHRDYNLNTWWLQNSLSLRISKVKKRSSPFN